MILELITVLFKPVLSFRYKQYIVSVSYRIYTHHHQDSVLMCRAVAKMMLDMNSAFNFLQYVCSARTFRNESVKLMKNMFSCCNRKCNKANRIKHHVKTENSKTIRESDQVKNYRFLNVSKCWKFNKVSEIDDREIDLPVRSNSQSGIERCSEMFIISTNQIMTEQSVDDIGLSK